MNESSPERTDLHSAETSIFMTNLPPNQGLGPESTQTIREYTDLFGSLMGLVDCIDSQFNASLLTHENDFMRAYKEQMQKVRLELQYLKK